MKTYWQAMDGDGKVYLYSTEKPKLKGNTYVAEDNCTSDFLYPINLKPLQIATITVNENGTWSWEIEREEGWYMARWSDKIDTLTNIFIKYENGFYYYPSRAEVSQRELKELTISSIRIPDKCII